MATYTTNLNLPKPEGTDNFKRVNYNELIDAIDVKCASNNYQTATGTGTAILLNLPTLTDGLSLTFIASADNGGASTTINGKSFYKPNTTTAPVITAGKAYTGWYKLSSDCFFIKSSGGGDDLKFPNLINFGNMTNLNVWTPTASTDTIANNILTNTGNGVDATPKTQYTLYTSTYAGQKLYARATVKVTNANCQRISMYFYDSTNTIYVDFVDNPVQNQEYTLSGIAEPILNGSHIYIFIRHEYVDKTTANGKVLLISKFIASDFSEFYGIGNEITQAEADDIVNINGGWWASYIDILGKGTTATASDILSPYTAIVNGNLVRGTMPTLSPTTYTPTTTNQTISYGQYIGGTQTILGDADLVASNIKKDVNIFNVTGTFNGICTAGTIYLLERYDIKSTSSTYRNKQREIRVYRSGTIRTEFSLCTNSSSGQAWGQIYVNNVAVGTERYLNGVTTYTDFTEDISVNAGDYVQLWIQSVSGYTASNNNFCIGISSVNEVSVIS